MFAGSQTDCFKALRKLNGRDIFKRNIAGKAALNDAPGIAGEPVSAFP
jgi:hypothetical protein